MCCATQLTLVLVTIPFVSLTASSVFMNTAKSQYASAEFGQLDDIVAIGVHMPFFLHQFTLGKVLQL